MLEHLNNSGWVPQIKESLPSFIWNAGNTPPLVSIHFVIGFSIVVLLLAHRLSEYRLPTTIFSYCAVIYNFTLSFTNLFLFVAVSVTAYRENRFNSVDSFLCTRPRANVGVIPFVVYLFFLSKLLEMGDVFLVALSGKKLDRYLMIHHVLSLVSVWHGIQSQSPLEILCISLNTFNHFFSYLYYSGAPCKKSVKNFLFSMQFCQFIFCSLGCAFNLYQRTYTNKPCDGSLSSEVHGLMLFIGMSLLRLYFDYNEVRKNKSIDNAKKTTNESFKIKKNKVCGPKVDVSEVMFQRSLQLALRFLLKTITVLSIGFLILTYLPWYMMPVGVFITATGMTWLYVIAQDCNSHAFFPSDKANDFFGAVISLPFIGGFNEDWKKISSTGKVVGAIAFVSAILYTKGPFTLLKCWILPLCAMHLHFLKDQDKKSYLTLFPELSSILKTTPQGVSADNVRNLLDDTERSVPIYNIELLVENVKNIFKSSDTTCTDQMDKSISQSFLKVARDVLFWGKRDTALYIAVTISSTMLINSALRPYSLIPLGFLVPFFFSSTVSSRSVSELVDSVSKTKTKFNIPYSFAEYCKVANWPMAIYITSVHIGAIYGAYLLFFSSWMTICISIILWPISGLGITAGAHRLWSHRSYEATLPLRIFLMVCNSMANQGTLYHWCRDHRVHHKFSETEADPHNAKRGFFFAHMGWLYVKKAPEVGEQGRKLNMADILEDPVVWFQKKTDPFFNLLVCFVFPAFLISHFTNDSFVMGLFIAGFLRYVFVLHFTWLVNSAAHIYGNRPYAEINPSENWFVSICAIGEGWHNYHHAYPSDYATSELGVSEQFNPTKLFIDFCLLVGLASNPKRSLNKWELKKAKLARENHVVESLEGPPMFRTRAIELIKKESNIEKVNISKNKNSALNKNNNINNNGNSNNSINNNDDIVINEIENNINNNSNNTNEDIDHNKESDTKKSKGNFVPDQFFEKAKHNNNNSNNNNANKKKVKIISNKNTCLSNTVPKDENHITFANLKKAIPKHLFEKSYYHSFISLIWDSFVSVLSLAIIVALGETGYTNVYYAMVPCYWFYQGLNWTALWVLAHECGHNAFTPSKVLNDAIGFVLHSFLLCPYYSWQISHAKHHRRTNHLSDGETWVPSTKNANSAIVKFYQSRIGTILRFAAISLAGFWFYLLKNASGARKYRNESHFDPNSTLFSEKERNKVRYSNFGLMMTFMFLAVCTWKFGFAAVFTYYLVPQMITNFYLTSITFMQHTHVDVPHFDTDEWTWYRGALSTIDRSMGSYFDAKLHHIVDSHVCHHIFSEMPYHNAKKATPFVRQFLGKYYKHEDNGGYFGYYKKFYDTVGEAFVVAKDEDEFYWFN